MNRIYPVTAFCLLLAASAAAQTTPAASGPSAPTGSYTPATEVRMTGIDTNSMTSPRNDGTPGSALYRVPITLSTFPDRTWGQLLVRHWNQPSRWTTMHRPGIASVSGNRIIRWNCIV